MLYFSTFLEFVSNTFNTLHIIFMTNVKHLNIYILLIFLKILYTIKKNKHLFLKQMYIK